MVKTAMREWYIITVKGVMGRGLKGHVHLEWAPEGRGRVPDLRARPETCEDLV